MNTLPVLGIDIAKAKFDVELHHASKIYRKTFTNDTAGFAAVRQWLAQQQASQAHVCLESTGSYWKDLALALHEAHHIVSVVNPAQIKHFGQSELKRTKNDVADAALLARFCESQHLEIRELRDLVRRLDDLNQMLNQEENRLGQNVTSQNVRESLETIIAMLKSQIREVKHQIHNHIQNHPGLRKQAE